MSKEKEELNPKENKVEKKNDLNRKKTEEVNKGRKEKSEVSVASKSKKTETKSIDATKKATLKDTSKVINKDANAKEENNLTKATTLKKDVKTISSKEINSSKNEKEKNKVTPNAEKVKEETIIEKIKSFIAKIVAMQEESKNEELAKKEKKKNTKKTETVDESKESLETVYLTEYYDLPYRYNETVVKILAQTPKRIFVYWDVADSDRTRYEKAFGKDFFEKTYPVLLVHNDDKNYTTEIPINDFANSWYIDIQDPKTKYTIQLGRKFREIPTNIDMYKIQEENIVLKTDYLPIAQSNILEVPNDRILFETMPTRITYRNVKTYEEKQKDISHIQTPYGVLYDIKEFYENNYKDEIEEEIFDFNNPLSGGLSSSSFK